MEPFPVRRGTPLLNSAVGSYLFAVGSVALSTVAVLVLPDVGHKAPFLMFWPAVMYTLWYTSIGPALLSIVLSALVVDFVLLPPYFSFAMTDWKNDLVRLALYVFIMSTTCYFLDRQRKRADFHIGLQDDLLELADEAIIITDPQHRVLYWNGGAERLYGWTKAEAIGKDPGTLLETTYPEAREECDRKLGASGTWHGRLLRRCMRGEYAVVDSMWTLHPATGAILQADMDVTQKSHAENEEKRLKTILRVLNEVNQALLHSQEEAHLLQQAVEIISRVGSYPLVWVGIAEHDEECSVRVAARAGSATDYLLDHHISWKADSPLGRAPGGVALRESRSVVCQDFPGTPELGPWQERAQHYGLNSVIAEPLVYQGRIVAALTVYAAEKDAFGEQEVSLMKELAGDLSVGIAAARARKAAEAEQEKRILLERQLEQSQRLEAVGQLAGGIAHDFNNLLMVIMAQTEMLTMKLQGDALRRADSVMASARRAAALTAQLLAFSRKQVIQPQVISLNQVVPGVEEMLKRLVREDIAVELMLCERPWMVEIDRSQFEQVIMNLAVNARDAMPEGGKLTVETANCALGAEQLIDHPLVPPGDYVMLAVSDTGTGMSSEVKARVFEPFFTTKESGKGTGLGLAMVYGIVKQNGGFIWLYSEVGHGTCFKIYLPRVYKTQLTTADSSGTGTARKRRKATVLLVEDDEALRSAVMEFLQSGEHEVIPAAGPVEACRLAMEHRSEINLMLTDVILRDGNGRQLVERLRQQGCTFKAVYMSGYTPNAIVHHGVLEPGMMFLQKPFSREMLLNIIESALD